MTGITCNARHAEIVKKEWTMRSPIFFFDSWTSIKNFVLFDVALIQKLNFSPIFTPPVPFWPYLPQWPIPHFLSLLDNVQKVWTWYCFIAGTLTNFYSFSSIMTQCVQKVYKSYQLNFSGKPIITSLTSILYSLTWYLSDSTIVITITK